MIERYDTAAECLRYGGHCWTDHPVGAELEQTCRHCPATRTFTRDGPRWNVTYQETA